MIVRIILLALITWFTSPTALAEGYRVMISKDVQYFNEISGPNSKYSGIINQSGRQLDAHKLKLIIDEKGSITTESKHDFSWESPIKIKSVETITEVIRLQNNVIRKVSVNEVGAPKIKSNYFYLWAGVFIALVGSAINMPGRVSSVAAAIAFATFFAFALVAAAIAFATFPATAAFGAGADAFATAAGPARAGAFAASVAGAGAFVGTFATDAGAGAFVRKLVWLAIALMVLSMVSMFFI